jgi:creatinine amidohydrolase
MSMKKWRELSWTDFRDMEKENTVVILPIGSMEQHGPYLPVATDAMCGERWAEAACEKLEDVNTVLMPIIWCSKSNEHIDFPGTVFLSTETLMHLVEDICASVARAGFKRLVVFNWHGGNTALLSTLSRDVRQKYGLMFYVIDIVGMFSSAAPEWLPKDSFDIHAGVIETSIMMALHPSLVKPLPTETVGSDFKHGRMSRAFKGYKILNPEGGDTYMAWLTSDLTEDGIIGDITGSNAPAGKELLEKLVDISCEVVREVATFDFKK